MKVLVSWSEVETIVFEYVKQHPELYVPGGMRDDLVFEWKWSDDVPAIEALIISDEEDIPFGNDEQERG